ncbi:MAG: hypothetical protein ABSF52_12415 [Syntrophobacteraceae bacterium]|jgi:hypothetical protein
MEAKIIDEKKLATRIASVLKVDRLHHFETFTVERLKQITIEGKIHLSSPNDFNDPWDCRPCFNMATLDDPEIYEHHAKWSDTISRRHNPNVTEEEQVRLATRLHGDRPSLVWQTYT